jgi:ferric hydroxamate transport system ATP-binding protein
LARLHKLDSGTISLGSGSGTEVADDATALSCREFARRVALLSQSRPHPSGLDVRDVVTFGRHPHRCRFSSLTDDDRAAITRAMELTGITSMAHRGVDQLSGGELQRVWLATCLAQDTDVLLLDEPTNHLDLRYQVEILDLVRDLADEHGTAVGVVLHDLNQAAAVADQVVLLSEGRVRAVGEPEDVLTATHVSEVYGLPVHTTLDRATGLVRVEPRGRHHQRRNLLRA